MQKISVSIILPVYNAGRILEKTLKSIEKQNVSVKKIIIIDDASTDNSVPIIKKFIQHSPLPFHLVTHKHNRGLSSSYNDGLNIAKTSHVVTWMQDCIAPKNGIKELLKPFIHKKSIAAACSKLYFPDNFGKHGNFWLQCLYARNSGKIMSGRNGAFCCFSLHALKKIGMFDEKRYRTAGEDADIFYKLSKIGQIVDADITVEHMKNNDVDFSLRQLFYKQHQHAEALGASFFEQSELSLKNMVRILIRPILVFGLLVSRLQTQFLIIIVFYSFFYTKNIYKTDWRNPRIILLPFINIALLFTTTFYFFRGIITQRQQL